MAPNDSATGGPLLPTPTSPVPLEDDDLDDFIQQFVVGITGMPPTMIFPRWQEEPPNLPPDGSDWAAIGVARRTGDTYAAEEHQADGTDVVTRHETLDILCSFYGPHCQGYGALFRDGLGVAQNHEVLFVNGMGLVSVGQLERNPEMVKSKWLAKSDLPFSIRRIIIRVYPVLDIASLDLTLQTEGAGFRYDVTLPPTPPSGGP